MRRASKALKTPVREFVTAKGDLIADLDELPDKAYALFDQDFFVFPTEYPGFKQVGALKSTASTRARESERE